MTGLMRYCRDARASLLPDLRHHAADPSSGSNASSSDPGLHRARSRREEVGTNFLRAVGQERRRRRSGRREGVDPGPTNRTNPKLESTRNLQEPPSSSQYTEQKPNTCPDICRTSLRDARPEYAPCHAGRAWHQPATAPAQTPSDYAPPDQDQSARRPQVDVRRGEAIRATFLLGHSKYLTHSSWRLCGKVWRLRHSCANRPPPQSSIPTLRRS